MALNLNNDMSYKAGRPNNNDYLIDELIEDAGSLKLAVGKNGSKIRKFIFTFGEKRKKLFWRLSRHDRG